jgi:hypothetical protein
MFKFVAACRAFSRLINSFGQGAMSKYTCLFLSSYLFFLGTCQHHSTCAAFTGLSITIPGALGTSRLLFLIFAAGLLLFAAWCPAQQQQKTGWCKAAIISDLNVFIIVLFNIYV